MSDWAAFTFMVAGQMVYKVGRVKTTDPLDFEYIGPFWETKEEAEKLAGKLNREEC